MSIPSRSNALYDEARRLIPGGTQLVSKRPEMFAPGLWPAYFREARGCEVVDLDGRTWLDMSAMGIGTCLLGYADPDVTAAVVARVQAGSMSTLNSPEDVELARALIELHPWAEQVRYARSGGEAMTVAVRIARAATGRSVIAFCGYHGWHDWYIAANRQVDASDDPLDGHLLPGLTPNGVPVELAGTALPFRYNRLDELEAIVDSTGDRLAAVVMEPTRHEHPDDGFLEGVRALADRVGAVLVFDEITSGFRFALGGVHLDYDVDPDIAVFGKAIGNGHPMAAVIGRRSVLDAAEESFISSTSWTEGVGPTAALATLAKMKRCDVAAHVDRIGGQLGRGLSTLAEERGIPLHVRGHPALSLWSFDHGQAGTLQTLFTVKMLDHGILSGAGFYTSFAHESQHVDRFLDAAGQALDEVADAIENNDADERLGSPTRHTGFRRLT
jgi:glutamate-1-semialdehyde 2,1-aminomutase